MKKFLLILLLIQIAWIPLAEGHPFTTETNPTQGSNVPAGITQISMNYSEVVEIDFSVLKVFDSNGDQIDNKDTSYFEGENSLVVTTRPLEDGVYTVTSKVLSKVDGLLTDDAFVFAVGEIKIDPALLTGQVTAAPWSGPGRASSSKFSRAALRILGVVISS